MNIHELEIKHIRCHEAIKLDFNTRVCVITGSNGSGKTTVLESIYIALRGGSFRGSDKDILREGDDWWRIDLKLEDDFDGRVVKFEDYKKTGKKKYEIDSRVFGRLPARYKKPVVLFQPDDLRLLDGSPSRRRKFIDNFIIQIDSTYQTILHKYERALKQRNNLLKKESSRDELFVWDMAISNYGAQIIEKRSQTIERINSQLNEAYGSISNTDDTITAHYSDTYISNISHKISNELQASYDRDKILGYTTVGPHRHDIEFEFNNQKVMSKASRGEVRSIILALKFVEVDLVTDTFGEVPCVLLDDVFAELDENRQRSLAEKCSNNQMIITSTNSLDDIVDSEVIRLG